VLILDFDGTLTDAEEEGKPFTAGFLDDLATLTGRPLAEIVQMHAEFEARILAEPHKYAWMMDGLPVAPASVDPYLRIKPIATMILEETGCRMDPRTQQNLLTGLLYKNNYRLSGTCFRPGAMELLHALFLAADDAFIITNSHTDAVISKLRKLAMDLADDCGPETGGAFLNWWIPRVLGNAKKYVALDHLDDPSKSRLELIGLVPDRMVYCLRPHYERALLELMGPLGCKWPDLTVVGDIFELDGACPMARGAQFGLLRNPATPDYEIKYLDGHPQARVLIEVSQILPFYREGRSAT